ncbi:hypothetical protein ICO38_002902 [Salmonella enterica]|nr:hypothetical protein [Salmonella enterica]
MTIAITDVVLRDAHQSLFATRLRLDDMLPIAAQLDDVGYGSLECWGGATFDACIRFLGEDPWVRLRELKKAMPKTPLQMLLRGQNLLGYLIKPVHYQRLQHTLERFTRYRSSLRSSEQANQTHVDALFNIQAKEQTAEPNSGLRGIDENTFNRVRQIFADPQAVHTADTLAQILGSSKTTARRYLEQGVKNNFLEAEISYGKVGRPERLYRGKV